MFIFALTVQDGLHYNALQGGLAILPMAVLFLCGSVLSPNLIGPHTPALGHRGDRPSQRRGIAVSGQGARGDP
jgi:hypothetical protein